MTIFLTADHHFGHRNIIRYCARPFRDVEEMDAAMVENWNAAIGKDDLVVHLGDFALASRKRIADLLDTLNGRKVLILGNHDRSRTAILDCGFDEVFKGEYQVEGLRCVHDPADAYPGETTLCGHVHDLYDELARPDGARVVNVGVDVREYAPVLAESLFASRPQLLTAREGK
jgi:calcineurin-like phosphoesterase family protein